MGHLSSIDAFLTFAVIANLITVLVSIIYIKSIYSGKTKPHTFTWFNWTLLAFITAYAQFSLNGGLSAWIFVFTAITSLFITILSLSRGVKKVTRIDWSAFLTSLIIIPVWYFTKNPVMALVLIMIIDSFSYIPTIRKSWNRPSTEPVSTYALAAINSAFTVLAVAEPTFSNTFYAAFAVLLDASFAIMLISRRNYLVYGFKHHLRHV